MSPLALRLIAAAALALVLAAQAGCAPRSSQRRRAFALGAAAFASLALGNGLSIAGLGAGPVLAASLVGVALIAASLLSLGRAYRAGELGDQMRRASALIADERARIEADSRRAGGGDGQS